MVRFDNRILAVFFCATVIAPTALLPKEIKPISEEARKEAQLLLDKAQKHILEGRFRVAEKILERVKTIDPENSMAYSLAGDIHLMTDELDRAEKDYLLALELSDRKDREYFRLGQLYYLKKNGDEAIKYFVKAMNENPGLYTCRFYIGMVQLTIKRDKEKTIEQWEAYRKLTPDDPQGPEIDKAIALLKQKDFQLPPPEQEFRFVIPQQGSGQMKGQPGVLVPGTGPGYTPGSGYQPGPGQNNGVPVIQLPGGSYVPYIQGSPEKEKSKNEGESIMELDDL